MLLTVSNRQLDAISTDFAEQQTRCCETTPRDARALFGNINTIAQQLRDGMLVNINKGF